ncbi:MAG: polysulfide reductase NrfD [Candidatus Heimdallarchaeota archaeon]|nr:polysulfide reductase NrfD [Candidatus Heimdallarchaeota archaeon]
MAVVTKDPIQELTGRQIVEKSMLETGRKTKILMVILLLIFLKGVYEYNRQYNDGLGVTGLNTKVFWGLYITNFVFFIGVSHAGTLISAILRVTGADWRTPITRLAEEITVLALIFGAISVFIDMGHLNRVFNVIRYGNIDSPLVWDFISITFYLIGSAIFLYLPLIPDFAYYRDNLDDKYRVRKFFYRILAIGWEGTEEQYEILEKNIKKMSFIIIPVAVSVHTVVSWIMSMMFRTGWSSTIFGPYFVVGAIFSGLAALLTAMILFTTFYNLQVYIKREHFISLSKLLVVFAAFYGYFTVSEYLTEAYRGEEGALDLLNQIFYGTYAGLFWYFVLGGLLIPVLLLIVAISNDQLSDRVTLTLILIATVMINVGMWIKRYLITVPAQARPAVDEGWHSYTPNSVEIWIFAAQLSGFVFLYILLSKLVPVISLWEVEHEEELAKEKSQ